MYDEVLCPHCGEKYKQLGNHWRWNPDHRPDFTQQQEEIITGLLMGDGWMRRSNKNPSVCCEMTSPNYLEYIDDIFDCLSTGVYLKKTAEESAKDMRDRNFRPNASAEDYSDMYLWQSRSHPDLQKWANWYKTGKKVWPDDIELTPTVLKHWYCGDGSWNNSGASNRITIGVSNEADNKDKINGLFQNVGLPSASNYNTFYRNDCSESCVMEFTVEQSHELWDYMGEPLPDFEYKWPEQYR